MISAARSWRSLPRPRSKAGRCRHQLFLPGRDRRHPARILDRQARRDHQRRACVAARPHRAEPVLLRPGRPVHQLSELARSPRRPWRDLPRRRRCPGASPERPGRAAGGKRGRARGSARTCGSRTHAGAVGSEPGAEGGSHGARGCRGPATPGPENGSGWPADRRDRARLQQHARRRRRRNRSCAAAPQRPPARGHDAPQQCDGRRDPRRRSDPPAAVVRTVRAAASGARRQQRADRRHVRPARPHARRADPGRNRPRVRCMADLRRSAPARECHRQSRSQRPRRDGRARA